VNQFITRRQPCKLCSGSGTMTLQYTGRWFSWCPQCAGTGWMTIRISVLNG